jgi:radical SAM superfamily enzyme YgiQ (UPF0313 family)
MPQEPSTGLCYNLNIASTVVSPDRATVASFDREGRLITYLQESSFFKRSLASELYLRWRRGGHRWRKLAEPEARSRIQEAYAVARQVLLGPDEPPPELRRRLEDEVLAWSVDELLAEGERFRRVYRPVSILPPDRYVSIVLQATEGCTWNRCTFCGFYQGRSFSAREPDELRRHAEGVRRLLGRDLLRRRGVFLGDGNALALSRRRLLPIFQVAREVFPGQSIYGFLDVYTGSKHDPVDWAELASLGLDRVYIGMETGLDELLSFVNKPGSTAELLSLVASLEEAGVGVSLIIMVGLGGREHAQRHRQATFEAVLQMPLGRGDLIYLSPFVELPGSEYARRRREAGLTPMDHDEVEAELAQMISSFRARGLRVSRYDIREFVY